MYLNPKNLPNIAAAEIAAWERGKPDVVIVVAPFASSTYPSFGPSLLMEGCLKRHINCHIFYANLIFAAMLGPELYQKISCESGALNGDAVFTPYAFCTSKDKLIHFISHNKNSLHLDLSIEEYNKIDEIIPDFLNYVSERLIGTEARIMGFSSMFKQNTSSLAIARYLKQGNPKLITVMGGSSVTNPMGKALSEIAPMIDYVFSGEADIEFPQFCDHILNDEYSSISRVVDCNLIDDMDSVEIPTFDDYFEQLLFLQDKNLLPREWPYTIPFESSRGCWWGEKCTCSFCGLNTINITYRKKSGARILAEIVHLRQKYNFDSFLASDCVMPHDFGDVLDDLCKLDKGLHFFYEVRSTVQAPLLDLFVKAGIVYLQPGIESLSTNVLKKMRKGVSALQNLKLLREARSRQINLAWNILVGIPGETEKDYEELLNILPSIEHFQPPKDVGPIRIDRYSPYFNDPAKFSISNLRPHALYKLIYPEDANLDELAYIFDADWESVYPGNIDMFNRLFAQLEHWRHLWTGPDDRPMVPLLKYSKEQPLLYYMEPMNGVRMIKDTRSIAKQTFTVLDNEAEALLYSLTEPSSTFSIHEESLPYLSELLDRSFVIQYENHYISLVTDPFIGIRLRKGMDSGASSQLAADLT